MSDLAAHAETLKQELAAAKAAGESQFLALFSHGLSHLAEAAKGLHPNLSEVEAALKPLVTELVQFAIDQLPESTFLSFLAPQIEAFALHFLDAELKKLFPAT